MLSNFVYFLLYGKHLFWRIAQFDWLLTGQDFPVLPTGNTQFLLPYKAVTRAKTFQDDQRMSKSCLNHQNEEKETKNTEKG